jgi:hypothetical protein
MNKRESAKARLSQKHLGLLAFIVLLLAIMAYKAYDEGWFLPRTPLELNGQPAVLFFNRHKGCECELVVYNAAERQIQAWPESNRQGILFVQIDLDRRPDLGAQFNVVRAPALLLLDGDENIRYRQNDVITDLEPLNLPALEQKIREVIDGDKSK